MGLYRVGEGSNYDNLDYTLNTIIYLKYWFNYKILCKYNIKICYINGFFVLIKKSNGFMKIYILIWQVCAVEIVIQKLISFEFHI